MDVTKEKSYEYRPYISGSWQGPCSILQPSAIVNQSSKISYLVAGDLTIILITHYVLQSKQGLIYITLRSPR